MHLSEVKEKIKMYVIFLYTSGAGSQYLDFHLFWFGFVLICQRSISMVRIALLWLQEGWFVLCLCYQRKRSDV